MLYHNANKPLKGRYWETSGGVWKAINLEGKQRTCKLQVEAMRYSETGAASLVEFTVSDIEKSLKDSGMVFDQDKIDRLKTLAHVGNVTRSDLRKVGLGDLQVNTPELNERAEEFLLVVTKNAGSIRKGQVIVTTNSLPNARAHAYKLIARGIPVTIRRGQSTIRTKATDRSPGVNRARYPTESFK